MYTISHAAVLTGVPVATLRAWERRYGIVRPARSESGYRLYDEQALQTLSAMGALVAAGWSPRQAADHLRDGAGRTPAHAADGPDEEADTEASPDLAVLSRGAAGHDPRVVEAALDEAFAVGGFERVVDEWLMPALRVLGSDWDSGRVDVAGEHLVSATVHRRLGAALDAAGRAAGAPRVLVGLARGSRHELGVLAFAVVLRRAGLDVVYLGADLPPQDWVAAARRHRPAAVVLATPMLADVVPVRETVAALHAASPETAVYIGGRAQEEVGGRTRPLGHVMQQAADDLARDLRAVHAP